MPLSKIFSSSASDAIFWPKKVIKHTIAIQPHKKTVALEHPRLHPSWLSWHSNFASFSATKTLTHLEPLYHREVIDSRTCDPMTVIVFPPTILGVSKKRLSVTNETILSKRTRPSRVLLEPVQDAIVPCLRPIFARRTLRGHGSDTRIGVCE